MSTATLTLVPLSEYLDRSFDPDCEYLDGVLLERNVGKRKHSRAQSLMVGALLTQEQRAGVAVLTGQRLRITANRVRIPDVCVIRTSDPDDQVVVQAPILCMEVLSPDDRMSEMQDRVDDYLSIGTGIVWIVDPWRRKAYTADPSGLHECPDGKLASKDSQLQVDCSLLWS